MFGGLRQGNLLYILEKNAQGATLRVAQVESVSNPTPRYGQMNQFSTPTDMVVDIKARHNDETLEFKQLNTSLSIANSGNLILSDSEKTMSAEVEALMRTSKQAIDATPYHQRMYADLKGIYMELNPQFAKEKEREDKINALEGKMGKIEGTLDKIQTMLTNLANVKS